MAIKQLSVFVENKQGKLSDVIKAIAKADINIRALSIADTQDFGILRMIVSDTDKALDILKDDMIASKTDVIAVKMNDKEGALGDILAVLEEAAINVDYAYAFTGSKELAAYVVFRVDDTKAAEDILSGKGIEIASEEDIKNI